MTKRPRRFHLILNPHGGRQQGQRLLRKIQPILESGHIEFSISETDSPGHARQLARQLDFNGYHGLIVIGGDGTMHEVVDGQLTRSDHKLLPIGLIPGGTGNSILSDLGIATPHAAAQAIIEGHKRAIDVVEIKMNDQILHALNLVGWGLVADIGSRAEKLRWLGPTRYTLASILEILRNKTRTAILILNDQAYQGEFSLIVACNTRYAGKGMKIAPQASLSDGLIDVVAVRHGAGWWRLLGLLNRIYDGSHVDSPLVEYHQVSRFSLDADVNEPLSIDGEVAGSTPFQVQMKPGAIEIFCPLVSNQNSALS